MNFLSTPLPQSMGVEVIVEKKRVAWNKGINTITSKTQQGYQNYLIQKRQEEKWLGITLEEWAIILDEKWSNLRRSFCKFGNLYHLRTYKNMFEHRYEQKRKNGRKVKTPKGVFESRTEAAKKLKLTPQGVGLLIKKNPTEYYYLD
jgi:hypothetical protein